MAQGRGHTRMWQHGDSVTGTQRHGDVVTGDTGVPCGWDRAPSPGQGSLGRGVPLPSSLFLHPIAPPGDTSGLLGTRSARGHPPLPLPVSPAVTSSCSRGWPRAPRRSSGSRAGCLQDGDGDGQGHQRGLPRATSPASLGGSRTGRGAGTRPHGPARGTSAGTRGQSQRLGHSRVLPMAHGSSCLGPTRQGSRYSLKISWLWLGSSPAGSRGHVTATPPAPQPPPPSPCPRPHLGSSCQS